MPSDNRIRVGIGVVTYNRRELVLRLIESIIDYTTSPFDLVVADDGSVDRTAYDLISRGVRVISGDNRGVCWNKNRALFYLHEVRRCDVVLLIEDDTVPKELGWERVWIDSTLRYGHIGLAGSWFRSEFLSGAGTVQEPFISGRLSGQCVGFSAEALSYIGYLDTRFVGYGVGHAEHSMRHVREGYGGEFVGAPGSTSFDDYRFYLISSALEVSDPGGNRTQEQIAKNHQVLSEISKDPVTRFPWSSDLEMRIFREEIKTAHALRCPLSDLDEEFYRKRYPDVASAIGKNTFPSARAHFFRYGMNEGRLHR